MLVKDLIKLLEGVNEHAHVFIEGELGGYNEVNAASTTYFAALTKPALGTGTHIKNDDRQITEMSVGEVLKEDGFAVKRGVMLGICLAHKEQS